MEVLKMNDSLTLERIAIKSENIEIAYKELKRLSQDEEKRMEYEARQKAIRDYNYLMYQSKQEGFIKIRFTTTNNCRVYRAVY